MDGGKVPSCLETEGSFLLEDQQLCLVSLLPSVGKGRKIPASHFSHFYHQPCISSRVSLGELAGYCSTSGITLFLSSNFALQRDEVKKSVDESEVRP